MQIKLLLKKVLYPLINIKDNKGLFKLLRQNKVKIGSSRLVDCCFSVHGNGSQIIIGDRCVIRGLRCLLCGDNSKVVIGNDVHVNASKSFPTIMNAFDGSMIMIGDSCLFSNSIELHTTDYHTIFQIGKGRINPVKDIILDNHVWVGLHTIILKGVHIPSDSVIGAGSIVASSFEESNTIIVGNPAKVIKRGINWDIRNLPIE